VGGSSRASDQDASPEESPTRDLYVPVNRQPCVAIPSAAPKVRRGEHSCPCEVGGIGLRKGSEEKCKGAQARMPVLLKPAGVGGALPGSFGDWQWPRRKRRRHPARSGCATSGDVERGDGLRSTGTLACAILVFLSGGWTDGESLDSPRYGATAPRGTECSFAPLRTRILAGCPIDTFRATLYAGPRRNKMATSRLVGTGSGRRYA
jgi:hypothetical protein